MGFLKFSKKTKLFMFVTALDQTVIARPNTKVSENIWEELPEYHSPDFEKNIPIINTVVFNHLQEVGRKEKYSFIFKSRKRLETILERLGIITLNPMLYRELEWLSKLGYFYHHTLAMTLLGGQFAIDNNLDSDDFNLLTESCLLHDIGISRLPQNILFSENLYSKEDRLIMQQHPFISNLLIGYYSRKQKRQVGKIILNHHSPEVIQVKSGIKTQPVNDFFTLILINLDIFDALISNRPFRPAFRFDDALLQVRLVNEKHQLPLDVVNWLEEYFKGVSTSKRKMEFPPYKPRIEFSQLN